MRSQRVPPYLFSPERSLRWYIPPEDEIFRGTFKHENGQM